MYGSPFDQVYLTPDIESKEFEEFARTSSSLHHLSKGSSASSATMPLGYDNTSLSDAENMGGVDDDDDRRQSMKRKDSKQMRSARPMSVVNNGVPAAWSEPRDDLFDPIDNFTNHGSSPDSPTQVEPSPGLTGVSTNLKDDFQSAGEEVDGEESQYGDALDDHTEAAAPEDEQSERGEVSDEEDNEAAADTIEVDNIPRPAKRRRTDRDFVKSEEESAFATHHLRKRKPTQLTPYSAVRVMREVQKEGRNATEKELNNRLNGRANASKPTKGQARTTKAKSRSVMKSDGRDRSPVSTAPSDDIDEQFMANNTVLRLELKGREEEGIEKRLANVEDLEALISYINDRFGLVRNTTFDHLTVDRPWKTKGGRLLMYEGWDDQFKMFTDSISEAKVWKTGSDRKLEVTMVIVLKDNLRKQAISAPDNSSTPVSKS